MPKHGDIVRDSLPSFLRIESALNAFVVASSTQDQGHIKPLHKYASLRLVIEGGFKPDEISPRPPLSISQRAGRNILSFDSTDETESESTIVGGVKSKNVDIVINKDGIGPVVAISVKGTGNAFRNLTNRMEEVIGDCANIHMMYPGLVYGFLHVIKANRAGQPNIGLNDVCIGPEGLVVPSIARWHNVLSELTGRTMLSDDVMRYEAITLILAETVAPNVGSLVMTFPTHDSPLLLEDFFRKLYFLYDLRFSYKLPRSVSARRLEWDEASPAFRDIEKHFAQDFEAALGYSPRLASC
jgi:hypothetical protein